MIQRKVDLTHLQAETYWDSNMNEQLIQFFDGMYKLKNLISLNIKFDMVKDKKIGEGDIQKLKRIFE